jgi:hypothetical protein
MQATNALLWPSYTQPSHAGFSSRTARSPSRITRCVSENQRRKTLHRPNLALKSLAQSVAVPRFNGCDLERILNVMAWGQALLAALFCVSGMGYTPPTSARYEKAHAMRYKTVYTAENAHTQKQFYYELMR